MKTEQMINRKLKENKEGENTTVLLAFNLWSKGTISSSPMQSMHQSSLHVSTTISPVSLLPHHYLKILIDTNIDKAMYFLMTLKRPMNWRTKSSKMRKKPWSTTIRGLLCIYTVKYWRLETLSIKFAYSSFKIQRYSGGSLFKQCRHEIYLVISSHYSCFFVPACDEIAQQDTRNNQNDSIVWNN